MKVLMLNGSAKIKGNTYTALSEIGKQLGREHGVCPPETERKSRTNFIR